MIEQVVVSSDSMVLQKKRTSKVSLFLSIKEAQLKQSKGSPMSLEEQIKLTVSLLKPVSTKQMVVSEKVLAMQNKQRMEMDAQTKNVKMMQLAAQLQKAIS